MKVLLISANTLSKPYPVYPIGLDYVAGSIVKEHTVQMMDMNTCPGYKLLLKTITNFLPDVIGISLRNVDTTDATDSTAFIGKYQGLLSTVKKACKAVIVIGGSAFTIFPAEMMKALEADYGIIGEGERLRLLLEALAHGKDPTSIEGVVTRAGGLNKCPPPWSGDFFRYFKPTAPHVGHYLKNGGMLNLQTKRGCAFKCIYCTYPGIEGPKLRLLPPRAVADTALKLQDAGAKFIFITDATFNSDYRHSLEVAAAFKQAGLKIPWGGFFAPTKPPVDYYHAMAESGLSHVEFGTESLSNRTLRAYGKPFKIKSVFEAHQAAINAGLHAAHYFLLGGPREDPSTLEETLLNVEKIKKSVFFFFCGMRIYPGTGLFDIALKEGQVSRDQDFLEATFYHSPLINSEDIVARVRERAADRPNWVMGAGTKTTQAITSRVYKRGFTGPLWEYMIR